MCCFSGFGGVGRLFFLGGVGGGILETENIDGQNVAPHPGIVLGIHLALKGLQPSSLSVM